MKNTQSSIVFINLFCIVFLLFSDTTIAQQNNPAINQGPNFWDKVQFGGGLGLNIGSGYTDITVSPSAIYNINPIVSAGASLLFGYVNTDYYNSFYYGGSIIGLVNPIPQVQLSAELEETRFNTTYELEGGNLSDKYWNTALYLGAGYRTQNITVGVRYDVLYNKDKSIYAEPFMPFVRVYF
ncbi:hypothetical protein [Flavobacterium sp. TAB 87]|uniref:hypothetical protein n=1 Tax=Flavobacterium sp. TAB 87 TaxID=1729581 RepID=UPI00076D4EEE|nr:hypothetical protein [Flavobacterium sp. TAB 87]KVV13614.1 hypothetical protein AP058_02979 [Flavobacterium sp. TAB 87]